jgi:hypothetical protein
MCPGRQGYTFRIAPVSGAIRKLALDETFRLLSSPMDGCPAFRELSGESPPSGLSAILLRHLLQLLENDGVSLARFYRLSIVAPETLIRIA